MTAVDTPCALFATAEVIPPSTGTGTRSCGAALRRGRPTSLLLLGLLLLGVIHVDEAIRLGVTEASSKGRSSRVRQAALSTEGRASSRYSWLTRRNASSSPVNVRHGERWRPVTVRSHAASSVAGRTLYPCSGKLPGRWEGEEWLLSAGSNCKPVEWPKDLQSVLRCLNGKRIAFLGDSHLRNLFRCAADELTQGGSRDEVGWLAPALNNASQPAGWPNYTHLEMHPRDWRIGGDFRDDQQHRLSCSNAAKVYRHDYSYTVRGGGGARVDLIFLWNPWGGDAPLLETAEAVEELGPEGAVYRFNYTGGRARRPFLEALRATKHVDLLVTGGEHRNHSALFQSFPSSAVLVDHAPVADELHAQAAAHDIPVADVSNALLSRWPQLDSPGAGLHGIPTVLHPPEDILRLQARLFFTLAVDKLCGQRSAPSSGRRIIRRMVRRIM